jgi:long-chain fatty acid transport protein
MKNFNLIFLALFTLCFAAVDSTSWATNGTQLIGVGPISRSMGGTGIANPQDAVSSIYLNPATMSYMNQNRIDFGATLFSPDVSGSFNSNSVGGSSQSGTSRFRPWPIPAIGWVSPLSEKAHIGFAAIGVGGLGTDFRNTNLYNSSFTLTTMSLIQMDFITAVSYKINDMIALGLSVPVSYQTLDVGSGADHAYGVSFKLGVSADFKAVNAGLYFKYTPIIPEHEAGTNLNNTGAGAYTSRMKIQPPMELGLGTGLKLIENLTVNLDAKYIFWRSAKGYGASTIGTPFGFYWDNQMVLALGLQYVMLKSLSLRMGYNYGSDPTTSKEATATNAVLLVRAPAIVKHHITLGIGYDITDTLQINLGGMIALKETKSITGYNSGFPLYATATHSQFSIDFGVSGKFN